MNVDSSQQMVIDRDSDQQVSSCYLLLKKFSKEVRRVHSYNSTNKLILIERVCNTIRIYHPCVQHEKILTKCDRQY